MKLIYKNIDLSKLGPAIGIETFCVIKGLKPVSRFNISEEMIPYTKSVYNQLGLFCGVSKLRFIPQKGKDKNVNLNVKEVTLIESKKGDSFFYISKSDDKITRTIEQFVDKTIIV